MSTALGLRFGVAALILLGVLVVGRRPLLPVPGERLAALLLGVVGYATESSFFYLGLSHGTAAAVALLFYSYPAIVTILDIVVRRARPRRSQLLALGLSASGIALVSASSGRVDISATGFVLVACSSFAFAIYLLVSERLMVRTDSLTTGAWVALGASIALLTRAVVTTGVHIGSSHWGELLGYGLATGAAFTLMFAALRRIGSSRTSVVMTLEAVCAIVLSAVFLGEPVRLVQAVGGAAVLAGAVIIGLSPGPAAATEAAAEAP